MRWWTDGRAASLPLLSLSAIALSVAWACGSDGGRADGDSAAAEAAGSAPATALRCAPNDGGLLLPDGFCAIVVAEGLGAARHIQVAGNGDVFVSLRSGGEGPGVAALRDEDGDGTADRVETWGESGGTGLALHDGFLYFGPDDAVLRYPLPEGSLTPSGPPDTIVSGLPADRSHAAKSITIDDEGALYVNVGSPSNSCQEEDRTAGSPGLDPCPELEARAGIWRFDADRTGQTQDDGERYATGIRNAVALEVHPETGQLFAVQHGRDQLAQNWPDLFDSRYSAENPAEELLVVDEGDDFGWPYCYYENDSGTKILAPEYGGEGGDGDETGRCEDVEGPEVAFPGHWAPNDIAFNTSDAFPARFRNGAFVAFHGSWNRAPEPQGGYNVVFVPFLGSMPAGNWDVFIEGFPGGDVSPGGAEHRPSGVAMGPDGSLYVADDQAGTVWRIVYAGEGGDGADDGPDDGPGAAAGVDGRTPGPAGALAAAPRG